MDFGLFISETDSIHHAVIILNESAILIPESGFDDRKTKATFIKKIIAWIKNIVRHIKKFYYTTITKLKNEFIGKSGIMRKLVLVLALDDDVFSNLPSFERPNIIDMTYDVLQKDGVSEPYLDVYGDTKDINLGLNQILSSIKKNDFDGALESATNLARNITEGDRYEGGAEPSLLNFNKENLEHVIFESRVRSLAYLDGDSNLDGLINGTPDDIKNAAIDGVMDGMTTEKGIPRQHVKTLFLRLMNMYNIINEMKIGMLDLETLFYKFERLADKRIKRMSSDNAKNELNRIHVLWSILNTMYSGNMKALRIAIQIHMYCQKTYEGTLKHVISNTQDLFHSREESIQILKDRGEYEEFLTIEVSLKKRNKEKDVDPSIIS